MPGRDQRFAILLRDAEGVLAGGLDGVIGWDWLFVDNLWVHDELQRQGHGRDLLSRAERYALDRGCHSVWLDTFRSDSTGSAATACSARCQTIRRDKRATSSASGWPRIDDPFGARVR